MKTEMFKRLKELEQLKRELSTQGYKKTIKGDGVVIDFLSDLAAGPVSKEDMPKPHFNLIRNTRAYLMNHKTPFTVLDDGRGNYQLEIRATKNK